MTNDEIRRVTEGATPGCDRHTDCAPGLNDYQRFYGTWNPSRALAALDVIEAAAANFDHKGRCGCDETDLPAALRAWEQLA